MLDVVAEELRERRASLSVLTKTKEAKEKEAKEKEDLGPDRERDHLIFWPLKPTENVQLEKVILSHIASKHGRGRKVDWGDPVRRLSDIRSLIEEAPRKKPEEKFLKGHLLYAAMLTHAMQHFPLEDGRLGIVWTWLDTDGRNKCTTYSGSTEIGMVLFNSGILYCELAAQMRQDNREDLQRAFRLYHVAAGFFEAAEQRTANEKRLTPDMSAANLEGLTKLCLAHAMHMYYLGKLVENTDDMGSLTSSDTLSKVAFDVAQCYYALHPLYADDKLREVIPDRLFYQLEAWWQIFEMRAHMHLARVEHVNKLFGQEVGRLFQAREWLHRAERSFRSLANRRSYEVIFRSKAELERAESAAKVAMAEANQTAVMDFMKLPPVRGTGKNPLKPCPCNDSFLATCPEDPFKNVPLLGIIAPRAAMPTPPRCPSPPQQWHSGSTPPLSARTTPLSARYATPPLSARYATPPSARQPSPSPRPPLSARGPDTQSRSGSFLGSFSYPRRNSFHGPRDSISAPSTPMPGGTEGNSPPETPRDSPPDTARSSPPETPERRPSIFREMGRKLSMRPGAAAAGAA
eukprot:EG_transcript_7756